ncbi:MAG: T9SS type A sorting domain-containing protein [Flavobacteriales bacterium]|nr:T9SS type A sorting domain-containing protein [Flavobacteriales bacterium]
MKIPRTRSITSLLFLLLSISSFAQHKGQPIDEALDNGAPVTELIHASQYLEFNNVKARFYSGGSDFWDPALGSASYEIPKGSGKHTIFTADLWIGGMDSSGVLHMGAQRYVQAGHDFYPGPVMDSINYNATEDALWDRLWKVNKVIVDDHIANWNQPGYTPAIEISEWPGNGDVAKGQAAVLAPYHDYNLDGFYNPLDGDYPLIKGDQTLYFMRNDDRDVHNETGASKMKIEIHGMAYVSSCLSDPALFTTILVNYKIVNRSANDYQSTYIGINADMDIGSATDDYIGCDVERSSFFTYNGTALDGSGAPSHYGQYPPAQSVTFLKGPLMDADTSDNPSGNCDEGVNGSGFGDGVIDNERFGMTNFAYYCNPGVGGCSGSTQGDPSTAVDWYSYMRGYWKDGTTMKYGGNGHANNCTSCETSRFMFPENSDTCNWGTGGAVPGDLVAWSEQAAMNAPNDRRGIGSMGPFTFEAGETIEMEIAYVYGRDMNNVGPYASVAAMKENIDSIRSYYSNNLTPCGGTFYETPVIPGVFDSDSRGENLVMYPNPASDLLTIKLLKASENVKYEINDLYGKNVKSGIIHSSDQINLSELSDGVYFLRLEDGSALYHRKFVKI